MPLWFGAQHKSTLASPSPETAFNPTGICAHGKGWSRSVTWEEKYDPICCPSPRFCGQDPARLTV